jgi:hypothetical protein
MRRYNIAFIVCLVAIFWSTTSSAVQVGIDAFTAFGTNSSGSFSFTDNFADGPPPPCGPAGCGNQPTFYGVNSTNPLPAEIGGFPLTLLLLDSSNGILSANAIGGARVVETVQVSGAKSELLSTGGAISMAGIFTLPTLSGPLNEGYGIRFIDAAPGSGPGSNQEALELDVQWWTGNASNPAGWYIRYLVQDFDLHTISTIDADLVLIPPGADEILLSLSRAAGSNQFAAEYAYLSGETPGTYVSLGSAAGFRYEDYVRPQFMAFETPVPEPATMLLLGSGLIGLWGARKKFKK